MNISNQQKSKRKNIIWRENLAVCLVSNHVALKNSSFWLMKHPMPFRTMNQMRVGFWH